MRASFGRGPAGETIAEKLQRRSINAGSCRIWIGSPDKFGYRQIAVNRRMRRVHRVAWEVANGRPAPAGLVIRHACDNPACINPDHLILGTQAENVADMISRHRFDRTGEKSNSAKLDWPTVRRIRADRATGATVAELSQRFEISKTQVRNILNNRHWKEPLMRTLAEMEATYGVTHHDYLDKSAEIPVVTGLAFQGDVGIVRRDNSTPATTPIPAVGFPVVRGENGGNTHALFGPAFFDAAPNASTDPSNLDLGTLTVPGDVQALLSHPEHGGLLIAPGTYTIRRQREQADVARFVRD